MTPDDVDLLTAEVVEALRRWALQLSLDSTDSFAELLGKGATADGPPGSIQVYTRGSFVEKRDAGGLLSEIELLGPEILTLDGPPKLFYHYRDRIGPGRKALIPADKIETTGGDWSIEYWNPDTREFSDAEDQTIIEDLVERGSDRPFELSDSATEPEV